jgi:exodeoxyribonuclease VII small subunit
VKRKTGPDFEANLNSLEQLVESLERGDLSLEDSLQQFERGVALIRSCQQALEAAEQRVKILTEAGQGEALEDFAPPAPDDHLADEADDEEP